MCKFFSFNQWGKKLIHLTENLMSLFFWVREPSSGDQGRYHWKGTPWQTFHHIKRNPSLYVTRRCGDRHRLTHALVIRTERKNIFYYKEIAIFMNLLRRGMVLTDNFLKLCIWLTLYLIDA